MFDWEGQYGRWKLQEMVPDKVLFKYYWPTFFQQYKQTIEDGTRFQGSPIAGVVSEKWQMFLIRASNFWAEAKRSYSFCDLSWCWKRSEDILLFVCYVSSDDFVDVEVILEQKSTRTVDFYKPRCVMQ